MMFVQTPMQFYILRFLLGIAEAGFYPGVIYYFAVWFPKCHRGRAVSRFYVATPLASILMGAISGALLDLDGAGQLHGWQWLFLVQGLPSVLVGLIVLRFLPDNPAAVSWLNSEEKAWIGDALQREQQEIGEPRARHILAAFLNPKVLLLGAIGFLLIGAIVTFVLSAPMVLAERTELDPTRVGYLVSIGGLLGAVTMLLAGNFADRKGDRFLHAAVFSLVMAAGILTIRLSSSPELVVIGYLAFALSCFTVPMLTSSGWAEVLHVRELAVGAAAINTLSQIGAFVSPYAWGAAKDASGRFDNGLVALAAMTLVMATLVMLLRAQIHSGQRRSAISAV